ncbi:MAG: murein L,D-transpeptidase catalytic domain family protein [Odoribacter sp.]
MKYCLLLYITLSFTLICRSQELPSLLCQRADSAFVFCRAQQMDTTICILVDMSLHSGKNRLFVWDFQQQKIVRSGLCSHGTGRGSTYAVPVFSNKPGSRCTSLGKYQICGRGYSRWGIHIHYKLNGLEKTNDNALRRVVVLHSMSQIPSKTIYPEYLPLGYSFGCPVVSDKVMRELDGILKNRSFPVLLWIYAG